MKMQAEIGVIHLRRRNSKISSHHKESLIKDRNGAQNRLSSEVPGETNPANTFDFGLGPKNYDS